MFTNAVFSRLFRCNLRTLDLKVHIAPPRVGKFHYHPEERWKFVGVSKNSRFRSPMTSDLGVNYKAKETNKYFPKHFSVMWYKTSANQDFQVDKETFLKMPLEEKRKTYKCASSYVTLARIPTWEEYAKSHGLLADSSNSVNKKVSLFEGDITSLEIDCIVNAANNKLMGGGGVDGAIHRAAGPELTAECATLGGCGTGDAKITGGYRLPAKYVIHTVGPIGEKADSLDSCYSTCLRILKDKNLKSIAFPCISTGVYGYPNERAAHVAIKAVRHWLEENANQVDRVIFCLFLKEDVNIYHKLMPHYFPS